jgi:hypothetical protein
VRVTTPLEDRGPHQRHDRPHPRARPSRTQLSTSAGSGSEVVTDPATEQELIERIEANVAAF